MKILLTKSNCEKCEYVKNTYDISDFIVFNLDDPLDAYNKYGIVTASRIVEEICKADGWLYAVRKLPILIENCKVLDADQPSALKVARKYLRRKNAKGFNN